jgi:hypothetical protein
VRIDLDQETSPRIPPDPAPDRPTTARTWGKWASTALLLALLLAGTSWAVASWVSPWLVLPYLILMALLLFPSTGRHQGAPGSEGSGSEALDNSRPARRLEGSDDPDFPSETSDSSGPPEDGSESEQAASSKPLKARRGKGRVKKAKLQPDLITEATWVQVAPGKFVRVEAADDSTGQAGPHSRVGTPVEPPATPQRLEFEGDEAPPEEPSPLEGPIEDAGPAFDPVEGPEGDPTGDVKSGSSTDLFEESETAGSPGIIEETSATDGNAPQAEGSLEGLEARSPDVRFEAVEDLTDVRLEDADERGATLEGTDPTETPVDETDLDDAGPVEVALRELEFSRDADLSATETLPEPSIGPSCWPWRLASVAQTRVGHHPPRSIARKSPPGRPLRSRQGARRPPDPRRLERQGLGRPRQIHRTLPPRSPPAGRALRGRTLASRNGLIFNNTQNTWQFHELFGVFSGPGLVKLSRSKPDELWSVAACTCLAGRRPDFVGSAIADHRQAMPEGRGPQ